MITWLEGVNKVKQQKSNVEKLISIKNDDKALSSIVAWQNIQIKRDEQGQPKDDSMDALWDWLWECVSFSMYDWRIMSGVKVQDADTMFQRLKGLKLIFPDGTAEDFATLYIRSVMNKAIFGENKQVGRPKKVKEEV